MSYLGRRLVIALSLCLALVVGTPAFAQESRGSIAGLVVDSSGGALPGVTVTIVNTGPADKTVHHLAYLGWAPAFLDSSMQVLQYWSGYHPPAGLATSFYKDARVDEWVVAADRESNPEKRKALYCDISKKVWADAPWLFLYVQRFPIVYSSKVTDVGSIPNEKFYAIYARPAQ